MYTVPPRYQVFLSNNTPVTEAVPIVKAIFKKFNYPRTQCHFNLANETMKILLIIADQQGLDLLIEREFDIAWTKYKDSICNN